MKRERERERRNVRAWRQRLFSLDDTLTIVICNRIATREVERKRAREGRGRTGLPIAIETHRLICSMFYLDDVFDLRLKYLRFQSEGETGTSRVWRLSISICFYYVYLSSGCKERSMRRSLVVSLTFIRRGGGARGLPRACPNVFLGAVNRSPLIVFDLRVCVKGTFVDERVWLMSLLASSKRRERHKGENGCS